MKKVEERISITLENCNQKIFGILHLPENIKNPPIVLFCHGLAGNKSGKFRVYVDLAYRLALKGIATFRFDYRGCGDSEGMFYDVTPSAHYSDSLLCLEYLKTYPGIDSTRIGIFGRSFGGPVAIKTASSFQEEIKSIALWCPMFDGEQWSDQWKLITKNEVSEEKKIKMMSVDGQQVSHSFFEEFFKINVNEDLSKIKKIPLLHIQGEKDTRVNNSHALHYEDCRKSGEAKSKFIKLTNSDHDFSDSTEREKALLETENWFVETLL